MNTTMNPVVIARQCTINQVSLCTALKEVVGSVFDIPVWEREKKFCEVIFVRKFEEILDVLFKNTKVFAKDGETSSVSAKTNQIINEDGTQYGRKLDILILGEQNDYEDIELSSNVFKKPAMKCHQQSKNMRLSACIWTKLFDISKKEDLTINYIDFIGTQVILTQLFFYKNSFVGHALYQVLIVMKSLVELEILYKSIKLIKKTSCEISVTVAQEVHEYGLADVYDTLSP
ncbi:MAG: hypothetical protein EXX96DRAFT_533593 [Benjaminiella poitrasii]|nr:MAG: hypothetical protein EXX96DRAFT_533593 [Benjaminiella poitrasii]